MFSRDIRGSHPEPVVLHAGRFSCHDIRAVRAVMVFAARPDEMAPWYAGALGLGPAELMRGGAAIVNAGAVELVITLRTR